MNQENQVCNISGDPKSEKYQQKKLFALISQVYTSSIARGKFHAPVEKLKWKIHVTISSRDSVNCFVTTDKVQLLELQQEWEEHLGIPLVL